MSDAPDFAPGLHLIADFHGCARLDDEAFLREVLTGAARAAGARVLEARFHHFGEGQGVTGVVLLAESHISVHSWPETGFAALDIFLCGRSDAHAALDHLRARLCPESEEISEIRRGQGNQRSQPSR